MAKDAKYDGYGIPDSLRRQRTNAFIVSIILLTLATSNASISGVGISGVAIEFENEKAIYMIIWAIWLYFVVRYFQYYVLQVSPHILLAFENRFDELVLPQVEEIVLKAMKEKHQDKAIKYKFERTLGNAYRVSKNHPEGKMIARWDAQKANGNVLSREELVMDRTNYRKESFRSWMYAAFLLPFGTDYYLPFLVYVGCGTVAVFSTWDGSPLVMIGCL